MEASGPQRYVLPGLLALLIFGALLIVLMSGDDGEPARSQQRPARSIPARPGAAPATHSVKVQRGDTATSIARSARITVDRLLELNPSLDPATLRPGQTLKLEP